jgi:predicted 3-demethylubiquinone-9 3-methyltransferase (glyoxalase superfamily)
VQALQCGWLKDKFGLSWQIVPTVLPALLGDKDRTKADRVIGDAADEEASRHSSARTRAKARTC